MSAVRSALVLSLACAGLLLSAPTHAKVAGASHIQAEAPIDTTPVMTTNDLTWGS